MIVMDWCSVYVRRFEMWDILLFDLCDLLEKCLWVDLKVWIEVFEVLSYEFFNLVEERLVVCDFCVFFFVRIIS